MSSPLDLASVRFDKAAFGYRADDVDDYVEEVGKVIQALVNEKHELETKLEVLATKLEEYKEDEESLRSAVLGAQKLGDSIIRDSKNKAEVLLRDATIRSERMVEAAHKKVEIEHQAYQQIHKEVAEFKNKLMGMYKAHLELISSLPQHEKNTPKSQEPAVSQVVEEPVPAQEEYVTPSTVEGAPSQLIYQDEPLPQVDESGLILDEDVSDPSQDIEMIDVGPGQEDAYAAPASSGSATAEDEMTPYQRYTSKYGTLLFGDDIDVR